MHPADTPALGKFLAVRPAWTAIRSARNAIGLEERTLLHCGPPVPAAVDLAQPTLNSAAVACVFEGGGAKTLPEALELVRSGEIEFAPTRTKARRIKCSSFQLAFAHDARPRYARVSPAAAAQSADRSVEGSQSQLKPGVRR